MPELNPQEAQATAERLAADVLKLSRNVLLVSLRFLDSAISALRPVSIPGGTMMTDGQRLYYNAMHILRGYKADKETTSRDYLHILFHCVFHHPFIHTLVDQDYWDLAVDIAAENAINELDLDMVDNIRQANQAAPIAKLKQSVKMITAEKLYRYFLDNPPSLEEYQRLRTLFYADDHTIWYGPPKPEWGIDAGKGDGEQEQQPSEGGPPSEGRQPSDASDPGMEDGGNPQQLPPSQALSRQDLEKIWADISKRMQVDLETTNRKQGSQAGMMSQNLLEVNRQRYNYKSFLERFSVLGEVMQVNDDEFDLIFYTYGLSLYANMPLIEPLEYKEVKRVKEFVIAIDTSGSVSGGLVQKFIEKTYNIFKQTENFFTKINLHIIQCDTVIQEAAKITSQEEFERYLKHLTLKGFGGTDFRPVFEYVDDMIRQKEFTNLRGMIYFTDGYGTFPSKKPQYETAFVFIKDSYDLPEVPPWAIRLVLEAEDIEDGPRK